MKNLQTFLELNGKMIIFLNKDGIYWVAIKPICEALGIIYKKQFDRIKTHPIFGPESTIWGIQVPGDQRRNYLCLPEEFIYGWISSINSSNPELIKFQYECYHILYQHFHGTITQRQNLLQHRTEILDRISDLSEQLSTNENFVELNKLRTKNMRLEKDLKKLDEILASGQTFIQFEKQ